MTVCGGGTGTVAGAGQERNAGAGYERIAGAGHDMRIITEMTDVRFSQSASSSLNSHLPGLNIDWLCRLGYFESRNMHPTGR